MNFVVNNYLIWIHLEHETNHLNSMKIKKTVCQSVFRGHSANRWAHQPAPCAQLFFLFPSFSPPVSVNLNHSPPPPLASARPSSAHLSDGPSSASPPLPPPLAPHRQ